MRALPVIHEADFKLTGPPVSRLPRSHVQKATVLQTVNLKPMGNTVSVTTLADNPFAGGRPVSVRTQASGGMANPDPSQMSRRLLHSHLPGLGADSPTIVATSPQKPAGTLDFLSTAAGAAATMYQQQQNIKLAQVQADVERQRALQAQWTNPMAAMGARSSITVPLLIVAGGALLTIGVIFLSRKGKGRRR
jgi:hypothetical protein